MRVLGAFVIALSLSSASAAAEPYISVFGGTGFSTLNSERVGFISEVGIGAGDPEEFSFTERREFPAGILAGGAIGYEFNLPVPGRARIELEGSHKRAQKGELSDFPDGAISPNVFAADEITNQIFEKVKSTAVMLNFVYVSSPIADLVSVYAGGGAGVSYIDFEFRFFQGVEIVDALLVGEFVDARLKSTTFQWQTMAGVSTEVTPHLELFIEGRFSRAKETDFEDLVLNGTFVRKQAYSHKSALVGVRFKFK